MALIFVDVEASAPGSAGYPIEIAWASLGSPRGISALIRPRPEWKVQGSWNARSQEIHGITPDLLAREGRDANRVAATFSDAVAGHSVLSDMPCADGPWISRLVGSSLPLLDFWEQVRLHGDRSLEAAAVEEVDALFPDRHRAAADVRRLRFLWGRIVGR